MDDLLDRVAEHARQVVERKLSRKALDADGYAAATFLALREALQREPKPRRRKEADAVPDAG